MYSTNFTVANKKFCLSLHYNGDSNYLFVNGKEIISFKAKDSEIIPYLLCLRNISKNFYPSNAAKTGLSGYVYDFTVAYWAIAYDKILDIYCKMFGFIKKKFFTARNFFNFSGLSVDSLECVSMNYQECKIISEIINVNTSEPMFYPYSIIVNKCKGSCNTINDPYAKLCVPDTIKNINVKCKII